MKRLREAISWMAARNPGQQPRPEGIKVMTKDLWRRYCYQGGISGADTSDDAKKKAFQRALKSLQTRGLIGIWEPFVWVAAC